MSRNIPFFEMFTELQLLGELRVKLAGAVLTGACIDQSAMSMELRLQVKLALTEGEVQELQSRGRLLRTGRRRWGRAIRPERC